MLGCGRNIQKLSKQESIYFATCRCCLTLLYCFTALFFTGVTRSCIWKASLAIDVTSVLNY
jgi:hypothetical protein